jgi:hypothetical protein
MRLITPQFSSFYYLILLCWFLPGTDAIAQPSGGSTPTPTLHHALLSDLFDTEYVVDTRVNPRLWFGCCKQIPACAGDAAQQKPMCHRLSKPVDGSRLRRELGANVVFKPVALNTENTRRLELPRALLNSNQLEDMPNDQALAQLYVTELDFQRLSDYSAIQKWSKYQHLSGVRGIRLIASADLGIDTLARGQVMKSLGIIFGRYFIVDVGGLSPALIELVLSYTSPRKLPVLMSGIHLGADHACHQAKQSQGVEQKQVCEIVRTGGVITIGPAWGTAGVVSD